MSRVTNDQRYLRNAFFTTTFKNDLALLTEVAKIWQQSLSTLAHVPDLFYMMLHQHILPIVTRQTLALGGNSLGLDPDDGSLIMLLLAPTWSHAADDIKVMTAAKAFIERVEAEARERGLYQRFKYLNYADGSQDVINGYGEVSKAALQAASRKYDPTGVFQRLVPGGFKVFP